MKKKFKLLFIIIIVFILIYLSFKSAVIKEVYYLLTMSFIIAYSLRPLQKVLTNRGMNKKLSAVIILTTFVIIALVCIVIVVPSIFKESLNISSSLTAVQHFIQNFYEKLKPLSNNKTMYLILDTIYTKTNSMLVALLTKIFNSVLSLGENLLSLAVVPLVVYYFLADGDIIGNRLIVIFPSKSRTMIRKILSDIDKVLGRYIMSQFLLCAIIGILTFFVLISLKVQYPIILSILNALFNIIPYFGPLFGAVPAIIVALLSSNKAAIWTAVLLYLIQQIEGNIISPKITGDSVSMHPLIVIILLIIGGKLGGFLGMVLAIPIGVVVKILYEDINYYLF
jgi:predicted PurR-regulated permease PerM